MIYFTADQHFSHSKIIDYCVRPFKSVHVMDKAIIDNHNEVVAPDDIVFMLGDFAMTKDPDRVERYLRKLNGHKHLILGNHDYLKPFHYVDCGFESVHTSMTLWDDTIFLSHDPAVCTVAQKRGYKRCLCGHVHDLFSEINDSKNGLVINVGVDVSDFTPVSLDSILERFKIAKGGKRFGS